MAPEPVTVPPVPTITTNGSPHIGLGAPTAPAPTLTRSPRRSPSPIALPPIQPPYIAKSIAEGLLRRSMSPNPKLGGNEIDERTSQNPAAILKSQASGMSKLSEAPTSPAPISQGPRLAPIETGHAGHLSPSIPSGPPSAIENLTSPNSVTSGVSLESGLTATAGLSSDVPPSRPRLGSISETLGPSYVGSATPGTPFSPVATIGENRGGSTFDSARGSVSSASGSRGRHECPNCQQTFTRHHNLKSHLLTHSHEKPFQCLTCGSRFRRLHDLKRHQKLHTGERPHVCNSCGRRFARGDALARHLRGEGGCAGRRSSVGGPGGAEGVYEGDNAAMEGLERTGDADEEMQDFDSVGEMSNPGPLRTSSLPASRSRQTSYSRVRQAAQRAQQAQNVQPSPSIPHRNVSHQTYPPVSTSSSGTFAAPAPPVPKNYGNSVTSTSQSGSGTSNPMSVSTPSTILQHGLTDSPRALSPSNPSFPIPSHDATSLGPPGRSPSSYPSTSSFHQQAMENRRRSTAGPSAGPSGGYSLPNPALHNQTSPRGHNSQLPAPLTRPGSYPSTHLAPPDQIQGSQSNIFNSGEQGIWAYIRDLEKRVRDLEEKNQNMEARLASINSERHAPPSSFSSQLSSTTAPKEGP